MNSVVGADERVEALEVLSGFRRVLYGCFARRADALFEAVDAVLCPDGPVTSLAELSLTAVYQRGHGALYGALNCGVVEFERLRWTVAGLALSRGSDGGVRLAVDVSAWPRPDAETSPERCHCYRPCRCDGVRQTIPGWPYSIVAVLESGRSSWTAVLDAVRLRPDDDATVVTESQLRDLVGRLVATGGWHAGDPLIVIVMDSGYDIVRLSYLLADLPVALVGRIVSTRVLHGPPGPRRGDHPGRAPRHGARAELRQPGTLGEPALTVLQDHDRYGYVIVEGWAGLHPKLERRAGWAGHQGPVPIVEGSVLRIRAGRLPGDRDPDPIWLFTTGPLTWDLMNTYWRTYLRRFDLEHTFRFFKQHLAWTRPRLRDPHAADRWTWLVIAAHTQLRLARTLTEDLRRPWEKPTQRGHHPSPLRVRRGYRRLRPILADPAHAAKATRPGPGRPVGTGTGPAPRHPVGKKGQKKDTPRRGGAIDQP
jgi:DDE superfamily endonuclease